MYRAEAQAHLSRVGVSGGAINRRRGHPTLLWVEVVLNRKSEIKPKLVGEGQLPLELLVTLSRCHARFVPCVGEMRIFILFHQTVHGKFFRQ